MIDDMDGLAAFLMHRSADRDVTDTERLEIYAAVGAYQEGYDQAQVEPLLRLAAARFAGHPDVQAEWLPAEGAS